MLGIHIFILIDGELVDPTARELGKDYFYIFEMFFNALVKDWISFIN